MFNDNVNNKISVFIDCENINSSYMEDIVNLLKDKGNIINIQCINDWSNQNTTWTKELCQKYPIEPICVFKNQGYKNICDMRLQRAVIECVNERIANYIAIVSSDSDFKDLVLYVRKCGLHAIGIGESKAPCVLRNSYNEFIELKRNESKQEISNSVFNLDEVERLKQAIQNTPPKDEKGWRNIAAVIRISKLKKEEFGISKSKSWISVFKRHEDIFDIQCTGNKKSTLEVRLKN